LSVKVRETYKNWIRFFQQEPAAKTPFRGKPAGINSETGGLLKNLSDVNGCIPSSAITALNARLKATGVNILLLMKTPDTLLLFYAVLNSGKNFINAELPLKESGTG